MIFSRAWAASETDAGHGAGGADVFPPFDPTTFASQLLWLAISFGLFYLLTSRVILPRIGAILEVRRDRISQDLSEAQRLKEESDAAIAAYEHELAQASANAHKIGQEAREQAKREADAEREKTEAELAGRLEEAEKRIADIKAQAMAQVGEIASDTATAIVGELLGGRISKAEVTRAVADAGARKA